MDSLAIAIGTSHGAYKFKSEPKLAFDVLEKISKKLGTPRVDNVVLLGALAAQLERDGVAGPELAADVWLKVITERVPPKHVELNKKAFQAGREAIKSKK